MKQAFIATVTLLALMGCNTAPVKLVDFKDQPVKHLYNQSISMQEVQLDVRMAAEKAGWSAIPGETPGRMTAIRNNGETSATVEIDFNLNKYSIRYKSSNSLDYQKGCPGKTADGKIKVEEKCISPTYNEWVTELNKEIANRLQY
ncbi:MAG: hypothetical protein Q8L69_00345 [Gallionellaceae bacterium]|nr:hypothetical protein [Gallionellaceae bacterium]